MIVEMTPDSLKIAKSPNLNGISVTDRRAGGNVGQQEVILSRWQALLLLCPANACFLVIYLQNCWLPFFSSTCERALARGSQKLFPVGLPFPTSVGTGAMWLCSVPLSG